MDIYKVIIYGIYFSYMVDVGQFFNSVYDVLNVIVWIYVVWWLWLMICFMCYFGWLSMIVFNIVFMGFDCILEIYDFFLEMLELNDMECDVICYLDEVLQVEDIVLVESV